MQFRRPRKSLLVLTVIVTLFLSMIASNMSVSAELPDDQQLTADVITDTSYVPGTVFTINIYVWDVEAMFGFQFYLYYNTTVLNATNFGNYDPFQVGYLTYINRTGGFVFLAYSMQSPELVGFYWAGQYPVAWIEFNVTDYGATLLDLYGTMIVDIHGNKMTHTVTDGFFANVAFIPHNIAVTDIRVSPTRNVKPGEFVSINVTVADRAPYDETFDLTVYANSTQIDVESVSLISLHESVKSFQWDTTLALSNYVITANVSVLPEETYTADNTRTFSDIVVVGLHDLAVVGVAVSPTSVATGDIVKINVTLSNLGNFTETFNATTRYTYLKDTPEGVQPPVKIETKPVTSLAARTNTTVLFEWNTTDVAFRAPNKAVYLSVEANVSKTNEPAVPYETNTGNNWDKMTGNVTVWLTGPVASFTYSGPPPLFEVYEGRTVSFDASASYSEGSIITGYEWDFGDGNITQVTVSTVQHIYITNKTYTVKLTVTDDKDVSRFTSRSIAVHRRDVAVLSVEPAATQVVLGKSVTIKVVVVNRGDRGAEAFNVTLYYDNTVISNKTASVALNGNDTLSFNWRTTGVTLGVHTLKAVAANVTGETNLSNNELVSDTTVTIVIHNISVTAVTPSPTEVTVGDSVSVSVTVANKGNFTESFSVALYYDNTTIQTQNVDNLAPGASKTLTFNWNTTGIDLKTYTLKAVASSVTDEVDKADNTLLAANSVTVNAVKTTTPPIPWEWVAAGIIVAVVAIAVIVYFLRVRKSRPPQ